MDFKQLKLTLFEEIKLKHFRIKLYYYTPHDIVKFLVFSLLYCFEFNCDIFIVFIHKKSFFKYYRF